MLWAELVHLHYSLQKALAADAHQFLMLSFGCFLPIVQRHSTVPKQNHIQAAAQDFTYVTLVKPHLFDGTMSDVEADALACRAGGAQHDADVEKAWLGRDLPRSSAQW